VKRAGQRFGLSNLELISFELFLFFVRRTIPKSVWAEIRTAYASGIGLREIARNMGIPEGTVLARAKREGWTREIQNAKALAKREESALAVTPVESSSSDLNGARPASPKAHGGGI